MARLLPSRNPGLNELAERVHGFYHRALLYAVRTLYGYREEACAWKRMADTCNIDADVVAEWVEKETRWIKSKSDWCPDHSNSIHLSVNGQLSAAVYWGSKRDFSAWAFMGKVRLCASVWKLHAAIADYYLYWAHRLYSYYMDGCGTDYHQQLGEYCARAALSEIIELAAVILHELSHLTGSKFHCNPAYEEVPPDLPVIDTGSAAGDAAASVLGVLIVLLVDLGLVASFPFLAALWVFLQLTDELLADTGDPPQDCCQYGLQWNCRFRLWAELGTPRPHILPQDTDATGTMSLDGAGGRFTTAKLDPKDHIGKFIDVCDVGTGEPNMWTTIYLYLTPESHGDFQWAIDSDCSSKSAHTGAETW